MSTPIANKRQRIDAAANALSKPFRSPFKTGVATPANTPDRSGARDVTSAGAKAAAPDDSPRPSRSTGCNLSLSRASRSSINSAGSTPVPNTDVDIRPISKTQRELEAKLRELKEDLHVIQQARKIEKDSLKDDDQGEVDGELRALAVKWKTASRMAADELFGVVKDRVNRTGGPRAWKEKQEQQKEFSRGFDDELPRNDDPDSDEEADPYDARDPPSAYDTAEVETELEKEERGGGEEDQDEIDGDEFTMPMMLKSMNVDLALIGYDRDNQRWAD